MGGGAAAGGAAAAGGTAAGTAAAGTAATAATAGTAATATTAGLTTAQMVGLGLNVAGTGLGAYSLYSAGAGQEQMAKIQAKQSRFMARDAGGLGTAEENERRIRIRQLLGTQRAIYGASGVDPNTGSPLSVQLDTAQFGEEDVLRIRNNAARSAWGYRTEASLSRTAGSLLKRRGMYEAGGTLLTGGSRAYGIWKGV